MKSSRVRVETAKERIQKSRKIKKKCDDVQSGVVYVGHLPHGFYEEQLKGYFSQFGDVNKVKVARNPKSGNCKGFAFVEFKCDEVAKIVAQTMNNYLMFNKLLKCQYVEQSQVHDGMVGKAYTLRRRVSLSHRRTEAQRCQNKCRTVTEHRQRISKLLHREKRKRNRLTQLGMNYDFPGYAASVNNSKHAKAPTHIMFK